jgi:hypothetical protein
MARTVRDVALASRAARSRLPESVKHWRLIERGLHLGYRRGPRGGTWLARCYIQGGRYREARLGTADDVLDTGGGVVDFTTAQRLAHEWCAHALRGEDEPAAGPYTVANAANDYLGWFAQHRKSLRETSMS